MLYWDLHTVKSIIWPCSVELYASKVPWKKIINNLEILINNIEKEYPELFQALLNKEVWLRGWCWKPRTFPGWFEGEGLRALEIMQKIQTTYWIICTTEVWTVSHLKDALDFGITHIWIWARSTSNPFLMDDLSNTIKEHIDIYWGFAKDIYVGVKNPNANDINLWLWALDRISKSWSTVFPIHRWYSFDKNLLHPSMQKYKNFRNLPYNEKDLLEVKHKYWILFEDYSHLVGERSKVKALLSYTKRNDIVLLNNKSPERLMLEVHPNPREALTDSKQQLTIEDLIIY